MEIKAYKVRAIRTIEQWDSDRVPYWGDEVFFEDIYPTRKVAEKSAKYLFDKQPINDHVESVWVRVYEVTITNAGMKYVDRVLNLFKQNEKEE